MSLQAFCAEIAQLVERRTENPGVPGSNPGLGTILRSPSRTAQSSFGWQATGFQSVQRQLLT